MRQTLSKANISRRRQEIREELSAPPRRSVDLQRGRQIIDLDDDEEGHFFNPQYMYRTDGRNENYDNASEVLIGVSLMMCLCFRSLKLPQPLNAKRRQWVQEEGARNMALALQTWRQSRKI
ncbi:hypothetical protein Taro_037558 [Colocasia esculenta]|uniref:Uncharacterized protein n=1 Tax=Colocasia esculenta TaxID=4460 RepID=A0A843WL48_COLES|nr:hypothetical protein [Colocasia esculenta]